jgi:hypothetical protein
MAAAAPKKMVPKRRLDIGCMFVYAMRKALMLYLQYGTRLVQNHSL